MHRSCPQLMLNSRCTSKPLMCWAADSHSCFLSLPALSILGKAHLFAEYLRKTLRNQTAIKHCHPRVVNYHYLWYQPGVCNKLWTFIALRCLLTSRLMHDIGLGWIFPHAGTGRRVSSLCEATSHLPTRADTPLTQGKHQRSETTHFPIRWVAKKKRTGYILGSKINSLDPGWHPREAEQGSLCSLSGVAGLCLRDAAFGSFLWGPVAVWGADRSHLHVLDGDLSFQSEGN